MLPYEVINGNAVVYRGEFQVPANFQEWEVGYQANVSAEDTNGAYAEAYAGELNVEGVPQFDEPPYINETVATPNVWGAWGPGGSETELPLEAASFSRFEGVLNVPANFTATPQAYSVEAFAEDDTGKPGSPPVAGQLRLPGDQFTLPGASGGSLSFSLAPGEEKTVTFGFQPSARGQQTARVALVRSDGRQPNRGASLYGWGVK